VGETHGKVRIKCNSPERDEFSTLSGLSIRLDIPWVSPTVIQILPLRGNREDALFLKLIYPNFQFSKFQARYYSKKSMD
jgi:hypothetical protein